MARKIEAPHPEEIAATGADDIAGNFVGEVRLLRDDVLRTRGGGDLAVYEKVMGDDQVRACWQQRRTAALAREWFVEPGGDTAQDKAAADFIREQLQAIRIDRVSEKMLTALFYGYAVGECLYRADGGRILLDAIRVRRQRRFRFDRDSRLRLIRPGSPAGEVMPDHKFWVFSAGADDDDDPYGLGLAHWLYWPVWLKRNGMRFWAIYQEKYAMPTALGTAPRGSDEKARRKLLAALQAISTDRGVVVPDGVAVTLLEATRSSGGDYLAFIDLMNGAIAKIILSQTMTTDNGSSKAQGQVHADRLKDVVKSDNDLLFESLNDGPVAWLTAWNFPGAARPRVWRDHTDAPDELLQAERDTKLYALGYEPTAEYMQDTYGLGWIRRPQPGPTPSPDSGAVPVDAASLTPGFAEAGPAPVIRDAADDLTDQLDAVAGPSLSALIDDVGRLLADATDLAGLDRVLLERGAVLPVDGLARQIARAMAVADLTGREDIAHDR